MTKLFSRILLFVVVILLFVGFDTWIRQSERFLPGTNEQYYKIVTLPVPDSLSFAGEQVPLDIFYVKEALDKELSVNTYWHSSTLQLMRNAMRWFPLFDSILKKNEIPEDFKYLPAIESGFSNVVSPAGAAGYWQFMKGTARDFGLEVNKEVDERYHLVKATEAACRYLLKSHEELGNWTLVAATYNVGFSRIKKELKRQKCDSFYDMLLNDETNRYIYRLLALKLIFENPEDYGFYLEKSEKYPPLPTYVVEVNGKIDNLADFAWEHGVSYKILKYFNPWLRQNYLKNRSKKTYYINLPYEPYNLTHISLKNKTNGQSAIE